MAAHDDPGDFGGKASINRSADEAGLVRELIEALTALGNYLAAAHREFENRENVLGEALRESLSQHERAAEAARRLRELVFGGSPGHEDRARPMMPQSDRVFPS